MTVYSDLRFIDAAVESVINQDFRELELIIVDDGTRQDGHMARLAGRDPRIRLIVNADNMGPAAAANRGIANARADIIARLDADDLAEPTRIRRLVCAFDADPQLGLVGTWFGTMAESGEPLESIRLPTTDLEIRWSLLVSNPLCHSSVAFRRACFEAVGGYREELHVLEDYDLWSRMLTICRAANLPDQLTRYRLNPRGLTATRGLDAALVDGLREPYWTRLGISHDREIARLIAIFNAGYDMPKDRPPKAFETLLTLLHRFLRAPRPLSRLEDQAIALRLVHETLARIEAQQSATLSLAIERWRLTRRARPFGSGIALLGGLARAALRPLRGKSD